MSFTDNLENLSPEELKAVANLVNKFAKRKGNDVKPQRRKKKNTKRQDRDLELPENLGREKRRKRIITDDNREVERPRAGRGRSQPTKEYNKKRETSGRRGGRRGGTKRGQGRGKTPARTEAVQLSGENRFDEMKERRGNKADSKIDKLLWKGKEVSTRSNEKYEPIEVQCKVCDMWFDVHPSTILMDEETGEANYTCNGCNGRR